MGGVPRSAGRVLRRGRVLRGAGRSARRTASRRTATARLEHTARAPRERGLSLHHLFDVSGIVGHPRHLPLVRGIGGHYYGDMGGGGACVEKGVGSGEWFLTVAP